MPTKSDKNSVVFFPGKFHPPHMGHLSTILKLLPKYKKVIIGVTEDQPENSMLSVERIIDIIETVFKKYNDISVCRIPGVLTEKESLEEMPNFDILLSGNPKVVEWAIRHNIIVKNVSRSEGLSGTDIREALIGED
jgi:cytidyltransferase-like protein